MKTSLIFGITGQDGSYLADALIDRGDTVIGVRRRSSTAGTERIDHILHDPQFTLIEGDVVDASSVYGIFRDHQPDECYNMAAQSHVGTSFKQPSFTFQVNTIGVLNILEAIRQVSPKTKMITASTSEMFGSNFDTTLNRSIKKIQNEDTPFAPNSPYGVSKLAAHDLIRIYRDSYNLNVCASICFNHESPRRGENFVTKKITKYIAQLKAYTDLYGKIEYWDDDRLYTNNHGASFPKLRLGNIKAQRDWAHSKDYCTAMVLMLGQPNQKFADFVIATGQTFSVTQLLEVAFSYIGIDNWNDYIVIDPEFYRPCEVEYLCGDATRIKNALGWTPTITFQELIEEMVQYDIEKLQRPPLQVMEKAGFCERPS